MHQSKILYVYLLIKSKLYLGNFDRCFISLHWILDRVCSNKKKILFQDSKHAVSWKLCVFQYKIRANRGLLTVLLKGQQREMVFWLNPSHIVQIERIQNFLKFVLLLTEIYTLLCLLASQENTPRFSLRLLHVRIDSFRAFSEYI